MHETHLFKNLINYLEREEASSGRKIRKIRVEVSELGGLDEGHILEHHREISAGSKWEGLDIDIEKIPYGPEFTLKKIYFE